VRKCILCGDPSKKGSVYCSSCEFKAHTAGEAAPKGTFKKTVIGRAKVVHAGNA